MNEEAKWLAEYVRTGAEEAFRNLVQRYLPLVYSAAVRRLGGDRALAQDVTQQVFVDFARKAGKLFSDAPLGGWLHRHTCFIAATALRAERRRKAREIQASQMSLTESNRGPEEILRSLDDAINQLGTEDRLAIVLRFLEQRDLASIGRALGTSDDAAQKRVTRALEKLRVLLKRQGVAMSGAGLATALATQTVSAVPPNLAAAVAAAALGSATASSGFTLAILKLMTTTQLKLGLAGLLIGGVSATLIVQQQSNSKLRAQVEALTQKAHELQQWEDQRVAGRQVDADELKRLRAESAELIQLRGQAAAFRQREQDLAQAQAEIRRLQSTRADSAAMPSALAAPIPAPSLKPAAEWINAGLATPTSAFETWNWAKATGDVDALAGTLVLDAEARSKAEALLASLPESVRARYGTVERMMATMQMNTRPIVAAQVVSQDQIDSDTVIVHTQWQYADGQLGGNDWSLRRQPDGWRVRISSGLVDKLGKGLKLGGLTSSP